MSPFGYLTISLCMTSILLAVLFFVAWLSISRERHVLVWSGAFLAGAAQWTVNIYRDTWFSDERLFWVTGNAMSLVVLSLAILGFRLRAGLKPRLFWLVAAALLVEIAVVWTTYVSPHQGLRMAIGPYYGAVILLTCVAIILRYHNPARHNSSPAEVGAAAVFGLFALSQTLAATAALMQGPAPDPHYLSLYAHINFLALPTAYIGMGLFTVFIIASDLSEQMKGLARTDPLTQIMNRRGFAESAARAMARSRRSGQALSLILGDLDHFKDVNDLHGHHVGDRVLIRFADHLLAGCRAQDEVGRLGGEEFVVLLPGTQLEEARKLADRLRLALHAVRVESDANPVQMTASFGVAQLRIEDDTIEDLIQRADRAMYRAKAAGRDQVEVERVRLVSA